MGTFYSIKTKQVSQRVEEKKLLPLFPQNEALFPLGVMEPITRLNISWMVKETFIGQVRKG